MKKRRTAAEVQELLKTPPPPEHIEAYREGGRRGLDKATEIVADQLAQGILTADQAKHVLKTIHGISSKHESECQRKVTMREFGTAFVEAQRAQFAAVVDGERNRAFHAPVIKRLERIETKLDNNTAITKDLAEELTTWREWVQKLATDKKNTTPVPKLCAAIQTAIVRLWETFNAQPADCEDTTEPSGWRSHKRTYNECLHLHGNDDIWHGRKLIELTPDAKALERVIHNAKEKKRQKKAAASAPQARRKK